MSPFSWDLAKAASNFAKHGVSFETATLAFEDPHSLVVPDPNHARRLRLMGYVGERLLLVVFIERVAEQIRIISARAATRPERKRYEEDPR